MPATPELRRKVEEWLKTQGYPLEMRTARTFRQRGWFLHHSRRYQDPITGKDREIDVVAFNRADGHWLDGHFVIECKWTASKPWVLFVAQDRAFSPKGYLMNAPMTTRATASLVDAVQDADVQGMPLFHDLDEGYMLVQAQLTTDPRNDAARDAAYTATHGVSSAAAAFAAKLDRKRRTSTRQFKRLTRRGPHTIIFFPVIVLQGDLFRCVLDDDGDPTISEIDAGLLLHRTSTHVRCIHVVRETALDAFIDRANATMSALRAKAVAPPPPAPPPEGGLVIPYGQD